jgi:TetR/AcrR family tetracycline transcriptional repressor
VKLTSDVIARGGLRVLGETGLDGLTMRVLAKELGVQAPTLYWHVKNKQELLDAMAELITAEASAGLEAPRRDEDWRDWLTAIAGRLRREMLRYRDGARVVAGSYSSGPQVRRNIELILRTLQDAGFDPAVAARAFPALLHYTVGFTIEEQARGGAAYDGNPYDGGLAVDAERFPLTASVADRFSYVDPDGDFTFGLNMIVAGMASLR